MGGGVDLDRSADLRIGQQFFLDEGARDQLVAIEPRPKLEQRALPPTPKDPTRQPGADNDRYQPATEEERPGH